MKLPGGHSFSNHLLQLKLVRKDKLRVTDKNGFISGRRRNLTFFGRSNFNVSFDEKPHALFTHRPKCSTTSEREKLCTWPHSKCISLDANQKMVDGSQTGCICLQRPISRIRWKRGRPWLPRVVRQGAAALTPGAPATQRSRGGGTRAPLLRSETRI